MNIKNIGILVDAENVGNPHLLAPIVRSAQRSGRLCALLLFGNWDSPALESWKSEEFKQQMARWGAVWQAVPKTRPGKNAADIALTFEAATLARDRHVNEMWLVSGDSDFTPMIERLEASKIPVVVFGPKTSTEGLRAVCTSFVPLDDMDHSIRTPVSCSQPQTIPNSFPAHRIHATAQQLVSSLRPDNRGWFHGFVRGLGDKFGFIRVSLVDELFFHSNNVDHPMKISDLRPGDPVEFKLGRNHRGIIAVHIRKTFGLSAE
jgi:cold shock CspA family protein